MRSEYAKASGRMNIFSSIERHLKAADATGSAWRQEAPEGCRYQRIEAQQRAMQETLQEMAGAVTDVLRIVASSREGNLDAVPDDMVCRLRSLEGDVGKDDA